MPAAQYEEGEEGQIGENEDKVDVAGLAQLMHNNGRTWEWQDFRDKCEPGLRKMFDNRFLGINTQARLTAVAISNPPVKVFMDVYTTLAPSTNYAFGPALAWGCVRQANQFRLRVYKVSTVLMLCSLLSGVAARAPDPGTVTRITATQADGYLILTSQAYTHRSKLKTEVVPLGFLQNILAKLQQVRDTAQLVNTTVGDVPLQCGPIPTEPTDLYAAGPPLRADNRITAVLAAPVHCEPDYHVVVSREPLSEPDSPGLLQSPAENPIYCSYFDSAASLANMLSIAQRSPHLPSMSKNSPWVKDVGRIVARLVHEKTGEPFVCGTNGRYPEFLPRTHERVFDSVLGLEFCVKLCRHYSKAAPPDRCTGASYNMRTQECYIYGNVSLYNFLELNSTLRWPSQADFYTISWTSDCILRDNRYSTPTILLGGRTMSADEVCCWIGPNERYRVTGYQPGGRLVRYTTASAEPAARLAQEISTFMSNVRRDYAANMTTVQTSGETEINQQRRPRSAVSLAVPGWSARELVKQLLRLTLLGTRTWSNINMDTTRDGNPSTGQLIDFQAGIRRVGQVAGLFQPTNLTLSDLAAQLQQFARRYGPAMRTRAARVNIAALRREFRKSVQWVKKLLASPKPVEANMFNNETEQYLYSPVVYTQQGQDTIYRRYITSTMPVWDPERIVATRVPITQSTYKKGAYQTYLGPPATAVQCLHNPAGPECPDSVAVPLRDIVVLEHPVLGYSAKIVTINQAGISIMIRCGPTNPIVTTILTGYSVYLLPIGCSLAVDGQVVLEPSELVHYQEHLLLYEANTTFMRASPRTINESVADNFWLGVAGVVGVTLVCLVLLVVTMYIRAVRRENRLQQKLWGKGSTYHPCGRDDLLLAGQENSPYRPRRQAPHISVTSLPSTVVTTV